MGRSWRIEFEGALYHIMARGNEGKDIFYNDADRFLFLKTLGDTVDRFEVDVFAYVLMGNHYHILMRTNRANLSKCMHWLGVTYTRRFNLRHNRCGHLFQGRFKSIIVENDAYLMRLSYYIHRNPLRSGIAERLAEYTWSSYKVYAYGYKPPEWLSRSLILSQLNVKDRHRAYRKKVQEYAEEEKKLLEDLRHGLFLGTRKFVEKICSEYLPKYPNPEIPQQREVSKRGNPIKLLNQAAQMIGCDLDDCKNSRRISMANKENRDLLVYCIWKTGLVTNEKIGNAFGITYSSVSHIVRSMKDRLEKEPHLNRQLNLIYSQFKM